MSTRALLCLLALAFLCSCDDDPVTKPPPLGPPTKGAGGAVTPVGGVSPTTTAASTTFGTDGAGTVGGDASATDVFPPDSATDGANVDTVASVECMSTCDCPPLTRCTADGCLPTAQLIWCCSEPTCPSGADCQDERGVPGTCP